jgi:methyl-accepting chemotaxis protein
MHAVVAREDLSRRVDLPYDDELGDSFNAMISSLERAFSEIKSYALGLERYYARVFDEAAEYFKRVLECLPGTASPGSSSNAARP